jgi:hypothetical protein
MFMRWVKVLRPDMAVLEEGGSALNAVKAALVILEDNILFNAARGSYLQKKVYRKWMPPSWTDQHLLRAPLPGAQCA